MRMRVFLKWLLVGAAAILAGVNLYLWNARTLAGQAMPMPFGIGVSVVLSGSMEPALSVNDLVIIRSESEPAAGDVVVYSSRDSLVIHRVISVDGDTLVTRGDANTLADAPVSREQVMGKMIAVIPGAGSIVLIFKQPAVAVILLALAVFLLTASQRAETRDSRKELDQLRSQIEQLRQEIDRDDP